MTQNKEDIDNSFRNVTRDALKTLDTSALEFMAKHPGLSILELAKRLNKGASGRGLTMLIYEEAERNRLTREVAKELLYRMINTKFPKGWIVDEDVHALVKLGRWDSAIAEFAKKWEDYASAVLKELTINSEPPIGWKPESPNDQLIRHVFDKCWPSEQLNSS